MKKINMLITFFLLSCITVNAQVLVSMNPNIGQQGQTLTTLITGSGTQFQSSSPNGNVFEIQLLKLGYDTIFPDTSTINIIDNTHFEVEIIIPPAAQKGLYDLYVKLGPGTNVTLPQAFRVGTPDGTISGIVYYDTNGNGAKDTGEPPLANERFYVTPDSNYVYSDALGNYSFETYNGTRTIEWRPTNAHYYLLSSANPSYTVLINNNNSSGNDFGLITAITSITPNQANAGVTLTTTLTGDNIFYQTSSPPGNLLNFNLPGVFNFSIPPDGYVVLDQDTATVTFTVHGNAVPGIYDVAITVVSNIFPFDNITYIRPDAFTIGPPDGYVDGTIYFDTDTNGVMDPGEFGVQYTNLFMTPDSVTISPDASGNFHFGVINGSHTVEIGNLGEFILSSADTAYTVTINNNTASGLDFGIKSHLYSISPNEGYQGQALTTSITGFETQFQSSSPQGNIHEMMLIKSGGGYTIQVPLANITQPVDSIHFDALIPVPVNADTGYYDVSVTVKQQGAPWIYHTYVLPHGFHVVEADAFISGNVFFDADSNKVLSAGDTGLANERLLLMPDNVYAFADANGDYTFGTYNGTHTVSWDPLPGGFMTLFSDSASYTVTANNNTQGGFDFGLRSVNEYYNSEILLSHNLPRCNMNVNYYVHYRNISNHPTNGSIIVGKAPTMTFVSAVPAPTLIQGDTITWDYANLLPLTPADIQIVFHLPGPGNNIQTQAIITAVDGGNTIQFADTSIVNPTITCSFDPNDKAVTPPGVQSQNYTLFGDLLDYMVRFQNTGNDTAFNVVIIDTLSASLDLSTFEVIASSHPVQTELKPNGIVTFRFHNILLPDSNVNEPASHGFVRYTVHALPGLPANTVITNTAHIFFDLNEAVATNTTTNTMVYVIPVSVYEPSAQNGIAIIFPNPFDETAMLKFYNPGNEIYTLRIFNTVGEMIRELKIHSGEIIIRKQILVAGIYFYSLKDGYGKNSFTGKFVIK
ncbi:MAG TPA: T9SS type A sorting domain-containing protein [Bacteroidia bacterium]|nr:T9SS type A sorting domain-containing protein [Bacteroidia bacterium]